jgi:hypothetical protein
MLEHPLVTSVATAKANPGHFGVFNERMSLAMLRKGSPTIPAGNNA